MIERFAEVHVLARVLVGNVQTEAASCQLVERDRFRLDGGPLDLYLVEGSARDLDGVVVSHDAGVASSRRELTLDIRLLRSDDVAAPVPYGQLDTRRSLQPLVTVAVDEKWSLDDVSGDRDRFRRGAVGGCDRISAAPQETQQGEPTIS